MLFVITLLAVFALGQGESLIRVNLHADCESLVNEIIQLNLAATFQYQAKAVHFFEYDTDYIGMAIMFKVHARMKLDEAKHLIKYLTKRGGHVVWEDIPKPPVTDWAHPKAVLTQALDIEKVILDKIIKAHTCAQEHHDPDLMHDMADNMIIGEEDTVFELGSYIKHLEHGNEMAVPAISAKMYLKYKDFKECFHAIDEEDTHIKGDEHHKEDEHH